MKRIKRLQPLIGLVLALVASTAVGAVDIPIRNPGGGTVSVTGGYSGNVPARARGQISLTSGVGGSVSNYSAVDGPSWITTANAGGGAATQSGTFTFTINRLGFYLVHACANVSSSGGITGTFMRHAWSGTATFFQQVANDTTSFGATSNDETLCSFRAVQITAAGQTVIINTQFNVSATSPVGFVNYTVIPL